MPITREFTPFKLFFLTLLAPSTLLYFRWNQVIQKEFWTDNLPPRFFEQENVLGMVLAFIFLIFVVDFIEVFATFYGKTFGKHLPVRGKHLDKPSFNEKITIGINEAIAPLVFFCGLRYAWHAGISFDPRDMTLLNTVVGGVLIDLIMEFFYYWLHVAMHIQWAYPRMHKDHHHQLAPSRGIVDSFNGSPLEFSIVNAFFFLGLVLTRKIINVHVYAFVLAQYFGGFCATLNHSRYEVSLSLLGYEFFNSAAHDVHHRIPPCNYSIYSLVWDKVFGTYRPYNHKDPVNPELQLDPATGRSFAYGKTQQKSQ